MADQLKNYETQLKYIYEIFYQNYTENIFKSDQVNQIQHKNATTFKLKKNSNLFYIPKDNQLHSNASVINMEFNPKDSKNSMSSSSSSSSIKLSSLLFKNTNTTTNNLVLPTTKIYTTPNTNTIPRRTKIHNKIMDKKGYHVDSFNILSDDSVAIPATLTTTTTTTTITTTPSTTMTTTTVKSKSCESESTKIVKIDINNDERNNKRKFSESFKDIKTGVVAIETKTNTLTNKEELFNKKDLIELKCKREEQIIEEENENPTATKRIKINSKTEKDEMFQIFQPWALRTYGDQAKTKTITLKKKQRILKALDGKEHNNPDSSKFRFWVKSKGFTTKKPETFIDTEIDNLMIIKDKGNLIIEKDNIDLYVASTSKDFGERFYRKVAVVEEFFNIIFDVHVNLGGRSGRHAGQKRTYRIITETYAFLPREAVTKFLSGCPDCKKNLRPFSPNRVDEQLTESSSEFETINSSVLNETISKPSKQLEISKNLSLKNHSKLLRIDNRRFSEPPSPNTSIISNIAIESRIPTTMSYLDDLAIKLSEFKSKSVDLNTENIKVYNNLVNYYQFLSKFYNQQQSTTVNWTTSPLNVIPKQLTNCLGMSTKNILELQNYLNPLKTIQDYQMLKEIPTTSCHSSNVIPNLNSLITEENNSVINLSSDSNDLKISSTISHHHYQQTSTKISIPCDISKDYLKKSSSISDTKSNLQSSYIYKPKAIEVSPEIVVLSSNSNSCCSDSDDDDDDNSRQTCAINLSKKIHETTKSSKCDFNTEVIDLKINTKNADDNDDNIDDRTDNQQMNLETVKEINMEIDSRKTVDDKVDFKPITSTYLKLTRSMGLSDEDALKIDDLETVPAPTPDPLPSEPSPEDAYAGFMKDADKLKLMLLAWNYQNSNAIRNGTGDVPDLGMVGGLWAQYQNALALNAKQPSVSPVLRTEQTSSPIENQDETNSSGQKDEDDGSEDDSDDKLDQNAQDPERLKAFNMFVRLFVDENLDRMIPISKQPKEKIQAIIDSCARQFPEFSERSRKRIRTYLKSCRRNKKAREGWDNSSRPTPAHLTSVQAEQILALACENESLNAKRMRVGLDPISQAVPLPGGIGSLSASSTNSTNIDTTAPSTTTTASSSSVYPGFRSTPNSIASNNDTDVTMVPVTTTTHSINSARSSPLALNANGMIVDAKNLSTSLTNPGLTNNNNNNLNTNNNNNIINNLNTNNLNNNGNTQCASPLYRPTDFTSPSSTSSPYQTGSRPPTYPTFFPSSTTGNPSPTDLSMKPSQHQQINNNNNNNIQLSSQCLTASSVVSAGLSPNSSRPPIVTHKLSANEITAARQVITAYRESAAFLLRTADQVEQLLIQQQ